MDNKQELIDKALKHVREQINGNLELYLAQVIANNPEINFLEYSLCHMPCYAEKDEEGIIKHYTKWWLEKIDEQ